MAKIQTLKYIVIGIILATLLGSSQQIAAASESSSEDNCDINQFLNKDGECIVSNKCAEINDIVTDRCQPMDKGNWPDGECPYGLVLGADDGCWHLEGYPIPEDHQKHHVDDENDFV